MRTRNLIGLILSAIIMITGCSKTETNKQLENRKKVHSDISSTLETTHKSIIKLIKNSKSFELVSQPSRDSSAPESIKYHKKWLLRPSDQPPLTEAKELLISSLESILKKHVPSDTAKLKYKAQVKCEENSVRVSINANWDR